MSRGKPAARAIALSNGIYTLFVEESRKRTIKRHHLELMNILINASTQGEAKSNGQITRDLDLSYNTVKTWRNRWTTFYPSILTFEQDPTGEGVSDTVLMGKILWQLM